MARKKYVTNSMTLHLSVEVEGKTKIVSFTGGVKSNALHIRGNFSTSDEKLQQAMETNPFFNDLFFLENVVEEEKNKEKRIEINVEGDEEAIPYTNKQDLYLKIQDRLPNADLSVSMTEKELLALATKNDLVFRKIK